MKIKHLLLTAAVALSACAVSAAEPFVNLTPKPKSMTVGEGVRALSDGVTFSSAGLDSEMAAELTKFLTDLNRTTGLNAVAVNSADANVVITRNAELADEGYNLSVTHEGVTIEAATPAGLYFAFQTVKKILPDNVMAGIPRSGNYALPIVEIQDEPRFAYRGFMLDVARHFFTVEEVKRMIDVMSYYKLNRFHWHLTDDQGWRIEMPAYPKLTTVGATAPNRRFTDMYSKTQYWLNKPYGPYFYTQDQLREVVAYAAERHIEVIPEVDMPGHFCAAMTAYPEFSCTPDGAHTVWSDGGISSDVLNVVNPGAIRFAKDILDVLIDIFPSETIHIGGDECPTTAWESNAECQAYYKANNLTDYRQLQSHFIRDMSDYVKSKGRRLALWNEAITATGADTRIIRDSGADIYCWTGPDDAAVKGTNLRLPCIYTPWGPYYINRTQAPNDPPGAGYGDDDVRKTYNTVPFNTVTSSKGREYCLGVQGTFWCEHVSDREYMEWLALPRLIAIAEAGWTPQELKDFSDFQIRMSADRKLLDLNGYKYSPHHMLDDGDTPVEPEEPETSILPDSSKWYRLISKATAPRTGTCVELLAEGSPKIGTGNAQVDRLWSNDVASETDVNYDCQWWRFEEDSDAPGRFAWVCMAKPDGSVNSTPSISETNTGRWDYDNAAKHYDFVFDTDNAAHFGTESDGTRYYAFRSAAVSNGNWVNMAAAGQQFSINLYNDPTDGNGGLFTFAVLPDGSEPETPAVNFFEQGSDYILLNAAEGFDGVSPADNGDENLAALADVWANNIWTATSVTAGANGTQSIVLTNLATSRAIASVGSETTRLAKPVILGSAGSSVTVTPSDEGDSVFSLSIGSDILWPVPAEAENAAATMRAGSNANGVSPRQGSVWTACKVRPALFTAVDPEGLTLFSDVRGIPVDADNGDLMALAPSIRDFSVTAAERQADGSVKCTYERISTTVTYLGRTTEGITIGREEVSVPVGSEIVLSIPEITGFSLISPGELSANNVVESVYSTEATVGVRCATARLTEIKPGMPCLIRDAHADRNAYRCENSDNRIFGSKSDLNLTPNHIWLLEANGTNYNIRNFNSGRYIRAVATNTVATTASAPYPFEITSAGNGQWQIKNSANDLCWDGNANLSLVGWSAPGHPYEFYDFTGRAFFTVTFNYVDPEGTLLASREVPVPAGETAVLILPYLTGREVLSIDGDDALTSVNADTTVTVVYSDDEQSSISSPLSTPTSQTIYDIHGRRLLKISRPGIYIVNGTKKHIIL